MIERFISLHRKRGMLWGPVSGSWGFPDQMPQAAGWEVQGQGAGVVNSWGRLSPWLVDPHFLAVSSCGRESGEGRERLEKGKELWAHFLFLLKKYLLVYFWLCWTLVESRRLSSCSATTQSRLSCSETRGILVPQPGIEPESSALEDGFLTTGPSGKYPTSSFYKDANPTFGVPSMCAHLNPIIHVSKRPHFQIWSHL